MLSAACRDESDSTGLSLFPDDGKKSPEGLDAANDAAVTWQQATMTRKGQKNKKKKSEGVSFYLHLFSPQQQL